MLEQSSECTTLNRIRFVNMSTILKSGSILIVLLISSLFGLCSSQQQIRGNNNKQDENVDLGDNFSGHFIENVLKGAFDEQMPVLQKNKMIDCMARLMCERICTRTIAGEVRNPRLSSVNYMINDGSEAKSIEYLFDGGDVGYLLGKQRNCEQCAYRYGKCRDAKYLEAKRQTDEFELSLNSV